MQIGANGQIQQDEMVEGHVTEEFTEGHNEELRPAPLLNAANIHESECVGEWTTWSSCPTCGEFKQLPAMSSSRPFIATTTNKTQLAACEIFPRTRNQACFVTNLLPCPLDCIWGQWSAWSTVCSSRCSYGVFFRHRFVAKPAMQNGLCLGSSTESKPCNQTLSCPADCSYAEWGDWGVLPNGTIEGCSATCWNETTFAQTSRFRLPLTHNSQCNYLRQTAACQNINPCPVDCVMGNWSDWSDCPATCSNVAAPPASVTRTRPLLQAAAWGGLPCSGALKETQDCKLTSCPIGCSYNAWSLWTPCSKICGLGSTKRTRTTNPELYGGADCTGSKVEEVPCQLKDCPIDCNVSDWSDWAPHVLCGSLANMVSTETISSQPLYGGMICPAADSLVQYKANHDAPLCGSGGEGGITVSSAITVILSSGNPMDFIKLAAARQACEAFVADGYGSGGSISYGDVNVTLDVNTDLTVRLGYSLTVAVGNSTIQNLDQKRLQQFLDLYNVTGFSVATLQTLEPASKSAAGRSVHISLVAMTLAGLACLSSAMRSLQFS